MNGKYHLMTCFWHVLQNIRSFQLLNSNLGWRRYFGSCDDNRCECLLKVWKPLIIRKRPQAWTASHKKETDNSLHFSNNQTGSLSSSEKQPASIRASSEVKLTSSSEMFSWSLRRPWNIQMSRLLINRLHNNQQFSMWLFCSDWPETPKSIPV